MDTALTQDAPPVAHTSELSVFLGRVFAATQRPGMTKEASATGSLG